MDRLLDKPEAKRFVKEFLDAWLKLDEINDTDPDRELYPEYAGDWWLVNSMVEESRLYFADLIAGDRPAGMSSTPTIHLLTNAWRGTTA